MLLYINEKGITLPIQGEGLYITLAVSDIQGGFAVIADRTNDFELVLTQEVATALTVNFGVNQEVNVYDATLQLDNGIYFGGKLIIKEIVRNNDVYTLTAQIISGNGNWTLPLMTTRLPDLYVPEIQHTWGEENDYVIYDLCDRGAFQEDYFLKIDRFPAVKLYIILKRIFSSQGIKLESAEFSTGSLKDIYILFTRDVFDKNDFKFPRFLALNTPETRTQAVQSLNFEPVEVKFWGAYNYSYIDWTPSLNNGDVYNNNKFNITEELDNQVVKIKTKLTISVGKSDPSIYMCDSAGTPTNFVAKIQIIKNNITIVSEQTISLSSFNVLYDISTETQYFRAHKNDYYKVRLQIIGWVKSDEVATYNIYLYIEQGVFKNYSHVWKADGEIVYANEILPDISQGDFIRNIFRTFDLQAVYKINERSVKIEPRVYYASQTRNVNAQLQKNKIKKYNTTEGKITLELDRDDEAHVKNTETERYSINVGEYIGTKEKIIKIPTCQTLTSKIQRVQFQGDAPLLMNSLPVYSILTSYPPQRTKYGFRLVNYEGVKSVETYKIEGQNYTTYKKLAPLTIDFVKDYYETYIKMMQYSWQVEGKIKLPPEEIVKIMNNYDGYYLPNVIVINNIPYIIEKIEIDGKNIHADITLITYPIAVNIVGGQPE